MSAHQKLVWIDVTQYIDFKFFLASLAAFLALELAAWGVANRAIWCQLQAYTGIGLLVLVLLTRERERRDKTELLVKPMDSVYCASCCSTESISVIVGSRAREYDNTVYQQLYVPMVRNSLMLALWLSWLAYGALFHEGRHEHAENSALSAVVGFSAYLPQALRTARALAYFVLALLSLVEPRTALVHTVIAVLLLPFPTGSATPQSLTLISLAARTSLFVALFVVAEIFELNSVHCRWLRKHDNDKAVTLAACEMALERAKRVRLKRVEQPAGANSTDTIIDVGDESAFGRRYSPHMATRYFLVALRSAWILVVSHSFMVLGVLQLALMFVAIARERSTLRRQIETQKLRGVRIQDEKHAATAKESGQHKAWTSSSQASSGQPRPAVRHRKRSPSPQAPPKKTTVPPEVSVRRSAINSTRRSRSIQRTPVQAQLRAQSEEVAQRRPSPPAVARTSAPERKVVVAAAAAAVVARSTSPTSSPTPKKDAAVCLKATMQQYKRAAALQTRPLPPSVVCSSPAGASASASAPSTSASSSKTER